MMLLQLLLILSSRVPGDVQPLHSFTFVNGLRDLEIVSLYVWETGGHFKGEDRIPDQPLTTGASVTFELPSGRCNILAFDGLGNSYGITGNIQKHVPDTVTVDLQHLTYDRPNLDHGDYLLTLENRIRGFTLDSLVLARFGDDGGILIGDIRIFPGGGAELWLDRGKYLLTAFDGLGREYQAGIVGIPGHTDGLTIDESMLAVLDEPLGVAGEGPLRLVLENCMPYSDITSASLYRGDSVLIYLEGVEIGPGESIVLCTAPGPVEIGVIDDSGSRYSLSDDFPETGTTRIYMTYDYLDYDFSFSSPEDSP